MANRWPAALVVCVVLAGCGGPTDGGTTTDATTEPATSAERVIAAPPENATSGGANRTTDGATRTAAGSAIETTRSGGVRSSVVTRRFV